MSQNDNQQGAESERSEWFDVDRREFMKLAGFTGTAGGALAVPTETASAVSFEEGDITNEEARSAVDYSLEHPRVYHTPEGVKQARENVATTDWGRELRDGIVASAESMPADYEANFAAMSDEELLATAPIISPDGETRYAFPYHTIESLSKGNRCPIDGSALNPVGLDHPGEVVCAEESHVFPGTHDGVEITDDGTGWELPADIPDDWAAAKEDIEPGTTFWFVATYNGRIAKYMCDSVQLLAYAYVVTAETRYAHTAAILLDILAEGTRTSLNYVVDYSPWAALLYRPGYTYSRIFQQQLDAADLVWASGELDADSPTTSGKSIKENVVENIAVKGAKFIWNDMHGGTEEFPHADYTRIFHNGTVDYNKGLLAAESLLHLDAGYAEFALSGQVSLQNFLANTIFRDGKYYETAYPYYGGFSFMEYAELAYLFENEQYPNGVDVYDNARFINRNVKAPTRYSVAGRGPYHGDSPADLQVYPEPQAGDFDLVLNFYGRADDKETRHRYAQKLAEIAGGDPNNELLTNASEEVNYWEVRGRAWPLFNIDGKITGYDLNEIGFESRDSELLPGKGFAMFRPENGYDRGASIRYGSSLSHTQADEMELHVYGAGRELSYDPGRFPRGQFEPSFLAQPVAHNMVVANETQPIPSDDDGGSVNVFADRTGYTVADLDNPQAYAHVGVERYRRTTALVDSSTETSYLVDIFRVAGAETTDYAFHSQGIHFDTDLDLSAPAKGSVASPEYFWGDQVKPTGVIEGFEDKPLRYNVPPGNGYGFLGHPRRASVDEVWNASWRVGESRGPPAQLRLSMLPDDNHEVIVTEGPDPLAWNLGYETPAASRGAVGVSSLENPGVSADEPVVNPLAVPDDDIEIEPLPVYLKEKLREYEAEAYYIRQFEKHRERDGEATPRRAGSIETVSPASIDANASSTAADPNIKYVLARDSSPGPSQYVSVVEPAEETFQVEQVETLSIASNHDHETFSPVAFKTVFDDDETTDYFLSTLSGTKFHAKDEELTFKTDATFAMVRTDTEGIQSVRMEKGGRLRITQHEPPITIDAPSSTYNARIVEVDYEAETLLVDSALPAGEQLAGKHVLVDAPDYSHNSPYRVERVEHVDGGARIHLDDTSLLLARGTVESVDGSVVVSPTQFPFIHSEGPYTPDLPPNEYFRGKRLVNRTDDAATTIEDTGGDWSELTVADANSFDAGDRFEVLDLKPGDTVTVPLSVEVRRDGDGYVVDAPDDVRLILGEEEEEDGEEEEEEDGEEEEEEDGEEEEDD